MASPEPAASTQAATVQTETAEFIDWYRQRNQDERLRMNWKLRIALASIGGIGTGFFLGTINGTNMAGLRFRAENAHRLPTSQKGWYLYHKSKNYNAMLGGITEGVKLGTKMAIASGGFIFLEYAVDEMRGTKDAGSTIVAGLASAGIFSAWSE